MQDALSRFYADVQSVDGVTPNGYMTSYVADAFIPAGMLNDGIMGLDGSAPLLANGSWYGSAYVNFVDEATWEAT